MDGIPRRRHREVIEETIRLAGARVADIGCGEGALVRAMAEAGARALGIEPSAGQIGRARGTDAADGEAYVRGRAEALPLAAACLDAAVFFNALHHVPVPHQGAALAEAARVLRPGGLLCIVEPLAEGPNFETVRSIDDETEVRAAAYAALSAAAAGPLFEEVREAFYRSPRRYADFAALRAHVIAVDERRRARVEAQEETLRRAFEANAVREDGAYLLDQPFRLNLLRRR